MNSITTPFKRSFVFATLALFLTGAGWLQAGSAGIQDNAGFFSAAAKADAQGNITLAQRTLHKDVQVETYATMPDTLKNGVNLQDKAAVNRAYEQWANKRAGSLAVNGVYIVIVKEPPHLQAVVGDDTQKQAFTLAERDSLVKLMADKLRAKDYDAALRQGVSYIVSNMKQHAPGHARTYGKTTGATANNNLPWNGNSSHHTQAAEKSGFPWGWVIALVVIFLIIRVIGSVLGALFRGNSGGMAGGGMPMGGGGYGGYPSSGGGGFMRSMFGGILGAAAGSWLYDSFFGSHGSSAYGAPPPSGGYDGGQDGGYTGQDTSYSSSGSDFGDSGSGGSSWDSGSSGGSDFGGGGSDFGGGGGDFGGGGDSGGGGSDF